MKPDSKRQKYLLRRQNAIQRYLQGKGKLPQDKRYLAEPDKVWAGYIEALGDLYINWDKI